jgi:hypothetical protein
MNYDFTGISHMTAVMLFTRRETTVPIISIPEKILKCFRYRRDNTKAPVPINSYLGNVPMPNANKNAPPSKVLLTARALENEA